VAWRRVVLDEAHAIANPRTKQSRAALALPAQLRWVVTGTPLQNKLEDLFAPFAFLRVRCPRPPLSLSLSLSLSRSVPTRSVNLVRERERERVHATGGSA
jgi:hypothetical protein